MATKTRQNRIKQLKTRFPSRNPNKKEGAKTIVSRDLALYIAGNIVDRRPRAAAKWLRAKILPALPKSSNWFSQLQKLARNLYLMGELKNPLGAFDYRPINLEGNKKLDFAAFSTLPQFTCPGAGDCLKFCYSFTSWRHVSPFCRQVFNTMAMKYRRDLVKEAFYSLPLGITFRLYVDGDFADFTQMRFWFRIIRNRPDVSVYGYSKSWEVFERYEKRFGTFPSNYVLNLSSGSKYSNHDKIKTFIRDNGKPLVRGEFIAVPTPGYRGEKRYSDREYHRAVREKVKSVYGDVPVFSCPGVCSSCTKSGKHACGSDSFQNVLIAIGVH